MANSAGLLDSDVHEVQDMWTGWKELCATNGVVKSSSKDIHFFWIVSPMKLPKIMGLKGIHFPKTLKWWTGLSFCPCCDTEGQNKGTVVNHLRTGHYHLGFVCSWYLECFMTSSSMMYHHAQGCQSAPTHGNADNNNDCEEESDVGNSKDDDNITLT